MFGGFGHDRRVVSEWVSEWVVVRCRTTSERASHSVSLSLWDRKYGGCDIAFMNNVHSTTSDQTRSDQIRPWRDKMKNIRQDFEHAGWHTTWQPKTSTCSAVVMDCDHSQENQYLGEKVMPSMFPGYVSRELGIWRHRLHIRGRVQRDWLWKERFMCHSLTLRRSFCLANFFSRHQLSSIYVFIVYGRKVTPDEVEDFYNFEYLSMIAERRGLT